MKVAFTKVFFRYTFKTKGSDRESRRIRKLGKFGGFFGLNLLSESYLRTFINHPKQYFATISNTSKLGVK